MRSASDQAHPDEAPARPLVVLSNRAPYAQREVRGVEQWTRTVGGLVSALDPVVRARGGRWVASSEPGASAMAPEDVAAYAIDGVPITEDEIEGYYRRVANGVLWPLMHSLTSLVHTQDAPWDVYRAVNLRFAHHAAEAGPDATYWVQDYQLTLVPGAIRAIHPHARIGWFNHIPWPAPEIFAMLPERREMLEELLGADLMGFQTPRDARNFLATVAELTPYVVRSEQGVVELGERRVTVKSFPIGIDVDTIQQIAADPNVREKSERLRSQLGSVKVLLAVDRLDYTKGMPERLLAFGQMLERHPELRQRVSLFQIAVPSRTDVEEYGKLKRQVDELVGQINGQYARPGWTPVHYLYQGFDLSELVAMYSLADACVVTPLRDGMNLVAHEFCAARLDNAGVLVLSEFAGAATILDGALQVNPYDLPRTADALARALAMAPEEQEERMRRLRGAVRKYRIGLWEQAFLSTLESLEPSGEGGRRHRRKAPDRTGQFRVR